MTENISLVGKDYHTVAMENAYQLAFNSFEASFAGNADKRAWEHKLKETFERCVEHDY